MIMASSSPVAEYESFKKVDDSELKLQERIGRGSFSTVYKGVFQNHKVAIKVLNTDYSNEAFKKEANIMDKLNHQKIVRFYGANVKKSCLVLEYLENGSLYNLLYNKDVEYSLKLGMSWLRQAADGINYLHSRDPQVIHRDIKSPNMLLGDNYRKLKLADFGLACEKGMTMESGKGSVVWMAPELITGTNYNEKIDVYSWSIIGWEILNRRLPFNANIRGVDIMAIMYAVGTGLSPSAIPEDCPKSIADLLTRCWCRIPYERPAIEDVVNELRQIELDLEIDQILPFVAHEDQSEPPIENSGSLTIPQSTIY